MGMTELEKDHMARKIALQVSCEEHIGCVKIIQAMVARIREDYTNAKERGDADAFYALGQLLTAFADGDDAICKQGVTLPPLEANRDDVEGDDAPVQEDSE